ncbi:MAG: hypothetical protein M1837_001720 [Sclerophora amabilis]|nr:MAG: hypothetical protein M1837_001720 [Sclerophora amabilis]
MADQLLESAQEIFEGQIDFEGQRLAELLITTLLAITGAVAFLVGYVLQDLHLSLYTGLAGTLLSFLVVVPPWPYFNRHPVNWLSSGKGISGVGIEMDGKKIR